MIIRKICGNCALWRKESLVNRCVNVDSPMYLEEMPEEYECGLCRFRWYEEGYLT